MLHQARDDLAGLVEQSHASLVLGDLTIENGGLDIDVSVPDNATLFIGGDLPMGCGLSSSAALEVASLAALSGACGVELEGTELARLAQRVENGHWNVPEAGDICMLRGSRSFFDCEAVDDDILRRAQEGDLHPGLPLWGNGLPADSPWLQRVPAGHADLCGFLEARGLELAWRPARLLSDDFSWQFCDDDTLQLDFALGAGNYATALLAEFVHHKENWKQKYKDKQGLIKGGRGSEQT